MADMADISKSKLIKKLPINYVWLISSEKCAKIFLFTKRLRASNRVLFINLIFYKPTRDIRTTSNKRFDVVTTSKQRLVPTVPCYPQLLFPISVTSGKISFP